MYHEWARSFHLFRDRTKGQHFPNDFGRSSSESFLQLGLATQVNEPKHALPGYMPPVREPKLLSSRCSKHLERYNNIGCGTGTTSNVSKSTQFMSEVITEQE